MKVNLFLNNLILNHFLSFDLALMQSYLNSTLIIQNEEYLVLAIN